MDDKIPSIKRKAQLKADIIKKDLLKFPGQTFKKADIRITYNIAWNQAVYVFAMLDMMGFIVSREGVHIPEVDSMRVS